MGDQRISNNVTCNVERDTTYATKTQQVYLFFHCDDSQFPGLEVDLNKTTVVVLAIDRNVPVFLVRFFMVWYCTQEFVIRWGKCCSTTFTTSNGVRQGGILSLLFFIVYMDKLSCTLNDVKAGCIMNGVYMNHLMYADDLVLIAPSVHALQVLLD